MSYSVSRYFIPLAALLVTLMAQQALCMIKVCLDVKAPTAQKQEELLKLVRTEMEYHSHFEVAQDNCDTRLEVEISGFMGKMAVTIRAGKQVPVRELYSNAGELERRVKRGIGLALGNEPVYLEKNISQYSEVQRAFHSAFVIGKLRFRMDLFENIVRTSRKPSFFPGVGVALEKGARKTYIFTRLHVSFRVPVHGGKEPEAILGVGLDGGLTYDFLNKAAVSPYAGLGLSVDYMRFSGMYENNREYANSYLFKALGRLGMKFLRFTDFDMDVYVQGRLPFFADVESPVFGTKKKIYTPSLQIGVGLGF